MEDGDGISVSETGRSIDTDADTDSSAKHFVSVESIVSSKSFKDLNVNTFEFNTLNGNYDDKAVPFSSTESTEFCVSKSTEKQLVTEFSDTNICVSEELSGISEDSLSNFYNSDNKEREKDKSITILNDPKPETVIPEAVNVSEKIDNLKKSEVVSENITIVDNDNGDIITMTPQFAESNDNIIEPITSNSEVLSASTSQDNNGMEGSSLCNIKSNENESGLKIKEHKNFPTEKYLGNGENNISSANSTGSVNEKILEESSPSTNTKSVDAKTSSDVETSSELIETKIIISKPDKKNTGSHKGKQAAQESQNKQETNDSNSKPSEGSRMCDRTRSSRKKSEDKGPASTPEFSVSSMYSFQYTGFKSTNNKTMLMEKKSKIFARTKRTKWNPFNPAWKRDFRNDRQCFMKRSCKEDLDCNTSQTEYAQYLGLQPIVKFRCSNCGTSTFQSMSSLNAHLVDCKKNGKLVNPQNDKISSTDTANIKLTRKVFLCSSCGTYYENCDLFLHMREYHRRYICLFCLYMTSTPDLLDEHLREKHKVVNQNYSTFEELQKYSPRSFFLLCLRCDKVFTEMDDSTNHKCINKNTTKMENSNKKIKLDPAPGSSQEIGFSPVMSEMSVQKLKPSRVLKEINPNNPTDIYDDLRPEASPNQTLSTESSEVLQNVASTVESGSSSQLDIMSSVESMSKTIESMELQIPKGIEIKPLMPGESKPEFTLPKNDVRPGIEIFPIPTPEQKSKIFNINKTGGLKKSMKRKKSGGLKLKKKINKTLEPPPVSEAADVVGNASVQETSFENITSSTSQETEPPPAELGFTSLETTEPLVSSDKETFESENSEIIKIEGDVSNEEKVGNETQNGDNIDETKEVPDIMETDQTFENKVDEEMETSLDLERKDETLVEKDKEEPILEEEKVIEKKEEEDSMSAVSNTETQDEESNSIELKEEYSVATEQMDITESSEENINVPTEIIKLKIPGENESDNESDDSNKLSLIVDENTNNSDIEPRRTESVEKVEETEEQMDEKSDGEHILNKNEVNDNIPLAREDVAAMALTLDDKIENVPIQLVLKECVRTSCLSCNFCRHAVRIAVNGKQLALHLLSEHRYTPVKNETSDDVIRKLKGSLDDLDKIFLNTESFDSSDPSIHVPYDKEINFDCFHCSFSAVNHKDLLAHKRKIHVKSLLLCIMCKISFHSYSELICHLCKGCYIPGGIYSSDAFRCCFCRLDNIPSAFRLMVHLRKSHHTCDICLEVCSDQQKLSTHMWKHKLNHLCYRCGIAYASKPDITKHLFWKHGTESVLCKKCLQKKWPHVYHFCIPPTSFNCEECNISFSKAVALKVHKRIHSNDFPYGCTQCEKKFVSKKLLSRHIDRHSQVIEKKESLVREEQKNEAVNTSENTTEEKETSQVSNTESSKDVESTETKDKCHKKHKKDKEKKEKKVVDVYDLPPLNLSSESDSSDDEKRAKTPSKKEHEGITKNDDNLIIPIEETLVKKEPMNEVAKVIERSIMDSDDKITEIPATLPDNVFPNVNLKGEERGNEVLFNESSIESNPTSLNSFLPLINKQETKVEDVTINQNEQVEGIWENFYRTNAPNPNLPYPLCAMKSEEAYNIIMGDHDYCQTVVMPSVKVVQPIAAILETPSLSDDKLEETIPVVPEHAATPPRESNDIRSSTPTSMSKKKLKSPKKKSPNKTSEDNNSSSSDSSSDTDSSSCSCGTNCSCSASSSSSNNSSSSTSDSDSSSPEDKTKQDKRKKKREKKVKVKTDVKESTQQEEVDVTPTPELEDPPVRESELETDESTSDEEFYDRHPKNIADQQLAEKRQSLIIASGLPVNNSEASSASPVLQPSPQLQETLTPPLVVETPKQKVRTKRRKKASPKAKVERKAPSTDIYSSYTNESKPSYTMFHQNTVTPKQRSQQKTPLQQNPLLASEAGGSGSETDNTRLSKRRRIKNKFYGYSSGEEEDKEKVQKWKKTDVATSGSGTPKYQPTSTPRIQLTVPKQVIRKPTYHKNQRQQQLVQPPAPPQSQSRPKAATSSDSSDSDTDIDDRVSRPQSATGTEETQKNEKDVYCYCRCPYDEVSEMIACDDKNCKIEWFHFECVGILVPPRGQWFCPGCRKARGLPT